MLIFNVFVYIGPWISCKTNILAWTTNPNFFALTFNQYYIYVQSFFGGRSLSQRPAIHFLCVFLLAYPLSLYPELEWLQHKKYFFKSAVFQGLCRVFKSMGIFTPTHVLFSLNSDATWKEKAAITKMPSSSLVFML